jgi:cytochrome c553
MGRIRCAVLLVLVWSMPWPWGRPAESTAALGAPVRSLGTGLLLEPPLDLSPFTRDAFVALSSTVGSHRIRRPWKEPVVTLPPHRRSGAHGLTEAEVRGYMGLARERFDRGESVPVSDVGLVSTQEDVIRQPMLNHIAAFSNDVVRVYLLVQKTASDKAWSYYSIVQDLTLTPALDYFAEFKTDGPRFEAASCLKCHSSGPLAIRPAREDLVMDPALASAVSQHIATQPRSQMHIPAGEKVGAPGAELELKFCSRCHSTEGDRAPLHASQSHVIRVLVDFGHMPPNRRLTEGEISDLKAWLGSGR